MRLSPNGTMAGCRISALALSVALLASCCTTQLKPIPNFAQVDKSVWRGGQPTAQGWTNLYQLGVHWVIKLNTDAEGSDELAAQLGMTVYKFPISVGEQLEGGPQLSTVSKAVAMLQRGNAYVHCGSDARTRSKLDVFLKTQGGQDRTGLVVGVYRVWVDGWPKAKAYAEMKSFGFHPLLKGLYDFWEEKVN